jgi:hypothetical protein
MLPAFFYCALQNAMTIGKSVTIGALQFDANAIDQEAG